MKLKFAFVIFVAIMLVMPMFAQQSWIEPEKEWSFAHMNQMGDFYYLPIRTLTLGGESAQLVVELLQSLEQRKNCSVISFNVITQAAGVVYLNGIFVKATPKPPTTKTK